jgi:hypothetical protein
VGDGSRRLLEGRDEQVDVLGFDVEDVDLGDHALVALDDGHAGHSCRSVVGQ